MHAFRASRRSIRVSLSLTLPCLHRPILRSAILQSTVCSIARCISNRDQGSFDACVTPKARAFLNTRATPPHQRPSGRADIAPVIERGWQGNYFLGVGDVRARPTGVGSEVTQSAPTASGQPINALRFLSSGRYVYVGINACARVDETCRRQLRPGPATPGAVIATTLANTSTWRTWTSRQYVTDENWRSHCDCH